VDIRRGKEDLLTTITTELGTCQVGSGTDYSCQRPAVIKIRGVPFCEPCACEQEAYFAIGELTEESRQLRDERLVGMLSRVRQTRLGCSVVDGRKPDAA
jgi:hypothetical protein